MLVIELQHELDFSSVGYKSANLGKAIAHQINVPPGFVLTRQALELFLEETGLLAQVQKLLSSPIGLMHKERTKAYEAFFDRLSTIPIPLSLIDSVEPLADELFAEAPCGLVVRSSGIYEDSTTASFAGVYESFLGIRTPEELWTAIRRCWCATWEPSALDYTKRMGIDPEPDAMAVLVQPLMPAQSAGVLFTAEPQTGNPWHFVLESTFGLAHELVGGTGATPADRFVLEWDSGRIIKKEIADKSTKWVGSASGLEEVPLSAQEQSTPSLTDEMATRIAQKALEIDRAFGCRVDIEWVVADNEVYIVQVRQITVLPPFFPYHLPENEADKTWQQVAYWTFPFAHPNVRATPPLYRDLSVSEIWSRYWPGATEEQILRHAVTEANINVHRYCGYLTSGKVISAEEQETYLDKYEATIRQMFLEAKRSKYPAILRKATGILEGGRSLKELIDAFFWVRDMFADLIGITAGPSQSLFGTTRNLLRSFMEQYAPDYEMDRLMQGYHPDLEPYYPYVQIAEAKKLAETIEEGPVRRAFEKMEPAELFIHLFEEHEIAPFMIAFADYCKRFGLYMPDHRRTLGAGERHRDAIRLVRDVLSGQDVDMTGLHERATCQRQTYAGEIRQMLTDTTPEVLSRFEKLYDWALFWGPALNDRGWAGVAQQRLYELWWMIREAVVQIGLVEETTDIIYFTAEDLAYIASIDDVEEGRRIWQRRRLEHERYERLIAPEFLDAAPAKPVPSQDSPQNITKAAEREDLADNISVRIEGKCCVPGQCSGLAYKIHALEEADTAGEQHILLLTQPVQPNASKAPLLFSMMLRVRGMVIVDGPMMWMHHVAQIARECGVPIVQICPEEMARIPDGAEVKLDGFQGTVAIRQ